MNPTTQQLIERMKALSADVLELSADMHANPDTAPYARSIAALSMPPHPAVRPAARPTTRQGACSGGGGMNAQHTRGRLKVGRKVARAIYTDAGHPVCMVDTMGEIQGDEVDQEFARRLVACWNALEDLPQAALDGGWTRAGLEAHALKLEQQARQMQAQRDELLAALRRLLASDPTGAIAQATDDELRAACYDSEADVIVREQSASILQARAAIAKVEGEKQ